MKISAADLRTIAARASTLLERFGPEYEPDSGETGADVARARLDRWIRKAAAGDRERWEKRLAWDGFDEIQAREVLGVVQPADGSKLSWTATLREILEAADASPDGDETGESRPLSLDDPVPFQELFLPFIVVARRRLRERAGSSYSDLGNGARSNLERALLKWLSYFSAPSLQLEFSIFLSLRRSSVFDRLAPAEDESSRALYRAYVSRMVEGGLIEFFLEYAVLARLCVVLTETWVDTMCVFLLRLQKDRPRITETFGCEETGLGVVDELGPFLSDRHRGGHAVIGLVFSCGLQLIYKPRDMGSEQAFGDLIDWVNAKGAAPALKRLKVLSCSGYGWVEYVVHEPTDDRQELERYYQRSGMLLAMAHALHGYDLHFENMIASGEHPVLIDVETLMRPLPGAESKERSRSGAEALANRMLRESVLETGLLPLWQVGARGESFDVSGLGGVSDQETDFAHLDWQHINTDAMTLEHQKLKRTAAQNVPFVSGTDHSPDRFVDDIVLGFQTAYELVLEHRDAPDFARCVSGLAHHEVRFIFRPTKTYGALFMKTLRPEYMRDGADRSIELESLAADFLGGDSKPSFWPILDREIRDLENLDIPYFSVLPESRSLEVCPGRTIDDWFEASGLERVMARIGDLDEGDMKRQIDLIRLSFHTQAPTPSMSASPELRTEGPRQIINLTPEKAIAEAVAIASDLQERAIMAPDGSATWITSAPVPPAGKFRIQPMGVDLYGGVCGVALFLAALEKTTGGAGFRELSLAALQPVRERLHDGKQAQALAGCALIGGLTGLGALIFTLVQTGRFLGDPSLLRDACRGASLMTPDRIENDSALDVVSGAAGAVLALLTLYDATDEEEFLRQAVLCGEHLRAQLVGRDDFDGRVAGRRDGVLLSGFSHGAAGMAYSLVQLHDASGNVLFLETAEDLLAYERTLFSPEKGNWQDLRQFDDGPPEPTFMTTWCHGAPGIGLARLAGLPLARLAPIRTEIEIALQTTRDFGLQGADNVCCGSFGRIEFLWTAGHRLDRQDLTDQALRQATRLMSRARKSGGYHLVTALPKGAYSPGFFQGASGIGYQLLRLADPASIPSVLLMEGTVQPRKADATERATR